MGDSKNRERERSETTKTAIAKNEGGGEFGKRATPHVPEFEPGHVLINRYRIIKVSGLGAEAIVYEAIDDKLGLPWGRTVALKFPRLGPEGWEPLKAEVSIAKEITHQNVCRVFDLHGDDDLLFISMEFVPKTLEKRIDECPDGIDLVELLRLARGLCEGLRAIHSAGKLHQDIKPTNIMIDQEGEAKIADFGLVSSQLMGYTPRYAAPEIWREEKPSVQSDLYSVGMVLFEMGVGLEAVNCVDRAQIASKLSRAVINHKLVDIILHCLEADPRRRPRSVSDVLKALEGVEIPENRAQTPPFNLRPNGTGPLRTKFIASVGWDASLASTTNVVKKFLEAGVDIIRLDLATCDSVDKARSLSDAARAAIVAVEAKAERFHAIWADLPGPNLRLIFAPDLDGLASERNSFRIAVSAKCTISVDAYLYADDLLLRDNLERFDQERNGSLCNNFSGLDDLTVNTDIQIAHGFFPEELSLEARLVQNLRASLATEDSFLVSSDIGLVLSLKDVWWEEGWLEFRTTRAVVSPAPSKSPVSVSFRGIDCWLPSCTRTDLQFAEALLCDDLGKDQGKQLIAFFGLRHVQTADEILRLQFLIETLVKQRLENETWDDARIVSPSIIPRIESCLGWKNRHFILDISDGVTVGDGDLSLPSEKGSSPERRRRLVTLANKRGKPAIGNCRYGADPEPSRDDSGDIFKMVQAGIDAITLPLSLAREADMNRTFRRLFSVTESAENFFEFRGIDRPEVQASLRRARLLDFVKDDYERIKENKLRIFESVQLWTKLAGQSEEFVPELMWRLNLYRQKNGKAKKQDVTNRITESACLLADTDNVNAIVTASTTGRTTRMISRMRASVSTVGITHDEINARKLTIVYGVIPRFINVQQGDDVEKMFDECVEEIGKNVPLSLLLQGQQIVFTCGFPLRQPGTTNLIQLRTFPSMPARAVTGAKTPRR